MKLTRYIGKTEFDAIEQAKKELGDDIIIMNTKKFKPKGLFGFFKKAQFEVLVGIDDKKPEESVKKSEFESLLQDSQETKKELQDIKDFMQKMSEKLDEKATSDDREERNSVRRKKKKRKKLPPRDRIVDNLADDFDIAYEDDYYEEDIDEIDNDIYVDNFEDYMKYKNKEKEHKLEQMPLYKNLLSKGVNEEISLDMCNLIMRQLSGKEASEEHINRLAKIAIKNMLGIPYQIPKEKNKKSIFFFIGPTGVGKTTTIAKIATKLSFIEGRELALVTTDTFRIAAVEQLRVYGDILNLPISVVYKPLELKEILYKYREKDIILVDTAGKSHLDEGMQEYVSSYLECAPDAEKFLLISLTTSYKDIESIVKSYSFLDDYKIIFTKIDEASMPGNILNIKQKTGKNTSFITNGQSVPDDIIVADPEEIAKIILGE